MTPLRPAFVAAALLLFAAGEGWAATVALETRVSLHVEAMVVEHGKTTPAGAPAEAEVGPGAPASLTIAVPWKKDNVVRVKLAARLGEAASGEETEVWLESTAAIPGGEPARASRSLRFGDEGTGLFEVLSDGSRKVILAIRGEQVRRPVVRHPAAPSEPVRFLVAVERVDGEKIVPLESDEMHTFVGQPVEYAFRLGEGDGLQALRLSLLPVSTSGDLVTIEAEIGGALPSPGGTVLVNRTEHIVASRLATTTVTATAGAPAAGYRFQVTPDF